MDRNPPLPPKQTNTNPLAQAPLPAPVPPPHPHAHDYTSSPQPQTQAHPQAQQQQQQLAPPPPGYLPPTLNLESKTKQDLHTILSTPDLQQALVHNPQTAHPSISASQAPLQHLISANTSLASNLLALEAHLNTTRDRTAQHLLAVRALEQTWRRKQSEMESRLEAFGPRVLHGRLGASIAEQEAVCRGLEDSFLLDGEGEVSEREAGEWIKRVREARKTWYLRRERRARWDEGRVGGWR